MFNMLNALASGAINLAKLDETGDQYALAIVSAAKSFVIPVIKTIAYVDDEKYEEDYATIQEIIDSINSNKLFKEVARFNIKSKKAVEHSHTVYGYCKNTLDKDVRPEGLDEVFKREGYTILEVKLESSMKPRDYTELLKNPEYKKMYDQNHAILEAAGASYSQLSTEVKAAAESVEKGELKGIIFTGPTGTGKSWNAMILADHCKAPLRNIQITYGTSTEDLVGSFIPNEGSIDSEGIGMKLHTIMCDTSMKIEEQVKACCDLITSSGATGKWKFIPGPLLASKVDGCHLVIEEVNYGQAGIIAKINEFTDDTPRITVNGVVYEANPNFVVYMTMNPGYAGTDPLNVALKNRFAVVDVPALTKAQFSDRAQKHSTAKGHKLSLDFYNKLYDFAAFLEKEGNSNAWHEDVKFSIRNANRLTDSILLRKKSLEEFKADIAIHYINNLSCDNDNSDKLTAFKKSDEIVNQIKALYDLYDFAEAKTVAKASSLEMFFSDEETTEDTVKKSKIADDIAERFGL